MTTSDFTSVARVAAVTVTGKGYPIELVNAAAFYDALGFAQRKMYDKTSDPSAPYFSADLARIRYKKVYL